MIILRTIAAVLVAGLLAGCGDSSVDERTRAAEPVSQADLLAAVVGDDIVLALHGPAGLASLDIAGIEAAGLVEKYTVDDPFVDGPLSFRGVWVADLLEAVGFEPDDTVRFHALDDYEVVLPLRELGRGQAFLATAEANGDAIPISDGGPIRLVFDESSTHATNNDLWIWSIDRIVAA